MVHVEKNMYKGGVTQEFFMQKGNILLSLELDTDTGDTSDFEALALQAAKRKQEK